MESVLLDTSVWLDSLQGKSPKMVSLIQALLNDDRVLTCGPVLFEIKRGLRPSERKKILPLFEALIRLPVDEDIWDTAGDLDADLRSKGITIPPMDVLIAQICLHHGTFLFTLDKHFYSVPGLKIFHPSENRSGE
ncbi:MAG: PIN domain-containing protein [Thermodesulfobacteriota bacterium]